MGKYLELIKKYKIEVNPEMGEDEETVEYWSCFNNRDGGTWHDGDTLEEAIDSLVEEANNG